MIEEALSLPGYRITAAEDGQQALQLFSEKEGWDLVVLELMLPKVDGLTVWDENFLKDENVINVTIRRLREQQGSLTARARLQEERERRMLVNISHDLKTPLTVVYGYAEMLLAPEQNLAPAVRTKVEKIYAKTRDVLDMLLLFF